MIYRGCHTILFSWSSMCKMSWCSHYQKRIVISARTTSYILFNLAVIETAIKYRWMMWNTIECFQWVCGPIKIGPKDWFFWVRATINSTHTGIEMHCMFSNSYYLPPKFMWDRASVKIEGLILLNFISLDSNFQQCESRREWVNCF